METYLLVLYYRQIHAWVLRKLYAPQAARLILAGEMQLPRHVWRAHSLCNSDIIVQSM